MLDTRTREILRGLQAYFNANMTCLGGSGTLQYVAPELFLGHNYTKSVDYWSLGLLAHEGRQNAIFFTFYGMICLWVTYNQKGRRAVICSVPIRDILVWIRIRGSMPLTNGSGSVSCYFRH